MSATAAADGSGRLALDAEIRRVRRTLVGGRRGGIAEHDADPDLAEAAAQDVRAVPGGVHPRLVDLGRGGEVARAPADVLAERPRPAGAHVAGALDAIGHPDAVGPVVREVAVVDHVAGVT